MNKYRRSKFPMAVDDLVFFSDTNVKERAAMEHYLELVNSGQYSAASEYLSQQISLDGYFAELYNMLESRIYNLQDYLLQKEKQPAIKFGKIQPTAEDMVSEKMWIDSSINEVITIYSGDLEYTASAQTLTIAKPFDATQYKFQVTVNGEIKFSAFVAVSDNTIFSYQSNEVSFEITQIGENWEVSYQNTMADSEPLQVLLQLIDE